MLRLEYSEKLGRVIRLDDPETLGVSSQTLAEEALRAGRYAEAIALVDYFHQEMRIMHEILVTWLTDIFRYLTTRAGVTDASEGMSHRLLETWRTFPLGVASRERAKTLIRAFARQPTAPPADLTEAVRLIDQMRLEFKIPHDVLVAWVQDLLTAIAERWGEEAVLEAILQTHAKIWGERYRVWDQLTPHEKLALTVEGMRGGHFSGPRRRGDVVLTDDGDRYRMVMDPCGSGGVLRRGDPESGRGPHPVPEHGTNRQPHFWTWQKIGVHWYCTHCCIAMEWLPGRTRGRPLRPLDHVLDPAAPCTWYIYKDEARTRAYHYPRTGLSIPAEAPDTGEDWRAEYPGGSPAQLTEKESSSIVCLKEGPYDSRR